MIKVLLVDDDALIREGLKIILGMEKEIEVVGALENGEECQNYLKDNDVDVLLLDMKMPKVSGIDVIKNINKDNIKILVLTTFDEDILINDAINNGANGYILKSSPPEKIISAIKAVYLGNVVYEKDFILALKSEAKKDFFEDKLLTAREMDIIRLISEGCSNKEISSSLYISEGTVKNHITNILSKTNLKHRTQIAIKYLE